MKRDDMVQQIANLTDQMKYLTQIIKEKDKQILKLIEQYMEQIRTIPDPVESEQMEKAERTNAKRMPKKASGQP